MFVVKSLMTVLVAAFVLTVTDAMAKDAVYRWVDDNGVVHYSDRPAASADAEKVDIPPYKTPHNQPAYNAEGPSYQQQPSAAQQQRDDRLKSRQEAARLKDEIAASCEQRRQTVAQLEPRTRVMVRGEDGEVYRLDDIERLKVLEEAKSFIAENCD